jgi:hypothetical protein
LELIISSFHLKALRDKAANGQYVRPKMLQNGSTELAGCVGLSFQQREKLIEPWKQFVRDIKAARTFLGKHASKISDKVEATMETGEYRPTSSQDAAQVRFKYT